MITVSHSEVEAFLLCRRKHFYGYTMGVEPIKQSVPLTRGKLGHGMLETYYRFLLKEPSNYSGAHKAAKNYLREHILPDNAEIVIELSKLNDMHDRVRPLSDYTVLEVEKEYLLPISPTVGYPFVTDLLVKDPAGKVVVVDHKFSYDFLSYGMLGILPQIPKYIGALRALGEQVDYGIYHQLRTRKLKDPTPEKVIQVTPLYPTTTRIARTFTEQLDVTQKLLRIHEFPLEHNSAWATRVGNKMVCASCSFLDICTAELSGENPQLILQSEYKARERRTFEEPNANN